jgi:magnesium transporter
MTHRVVVESADPPFRWIDIVEPTAEELKTVAATYDLFPTLVADSLDPEHLPKFERVGQVNFVIARAYDEQSADHASTVQELTRKVAIFAGPDFVITIHRTDQPYFAKLRARYEERAARAGPAGYGERRRSLPTRLLIELLNAAIATYEAPLEGVEARLDGIEDDLFRDVVTAALLRDVYMLKRRVTLVKRMLWHTLNATARMTPVGSPSAPLFQDVRENAESMHAYADELLEDSNNLLHIHLGLASQRTNRIVRVLTLFSVFFLPLTFIVGIYGMNFRYMPELEHRAGYPAVWGVMIAVTLAIYLWFRRRGWLGE